MRAAFFPVDDWAGGEIFAVGLQLHFRIGGLKCDHMAVAFE
jgi:hypothetical protein